MRCDRKSGTERTQRCDKDDLLLYAITDRSWLGDETLADQVEKALKGGATFLQLREKALETESVLKEAKEIKELCRKYRVPFIVNDNVDVAIASGADGVHVGQKDMEAGDVRRIIGEDKILGVSAQTVEQAVLAEKMGADYLGVGTVFSTDSKDDADDVSHDTLKAICGAVRIPVVAIGGIARENVAELAGTGICGISVISAIFAQPDIAGSTAELKKLTEKMVNERGCAGMIAKESNEMIAGAIFDLDGTVLDSMKVWEDAPELYLESLGIKAEPGLGKTLFPMSMAEGAEFLKEHYCPDKDADAIIKGVNRIVRDFYFEQVRLKEGVGQFLKDLKQAGIKITAATTSDREFVEKALERLDILDCFDRIFTCTEIGAGKSQPDIFLAAAEYMETVPGSTWVFEDSLYAIKTAKKAGFRTVGVYDESAGEDQEEIRSLADIYLERLGDVAAFSGDVAAFSAKLKCCHSAEQEEI